MSTGSPASCIPSPTNASATSTPSAVELPTTATRGPAGSGWWDSSRAVSNSSASVSTRMTPACSNNARTLASSIGSVCAASPATGRVCRPLFTATIGLVRASRRATRANFRGLPNVSRYRSTRSVAGSVCQYCSMSLPDRSARLPAETKVDSPRPRLRAAARIAMPSAPDCAKNPIRPRPGRSGREGGVEPHLGGGVGHPERVGADHAHAVRAGRRDEAPLGQHALRPRLREPGAHDDERGDALGEAGARGRRRCPAAGTATTARSTSSGMSVTEAYARTPRTERASAWTG